MNEEIIENICIALIDDDPDDVFLMKETLAESVFLKAEINVYSSYELGMEALKKDVADLYLIDQYLGSGEGAHLMEQARLEGVRKPLILLTGSDNADVALEAMEAGADDYLLKTELTAPLLERSLRYALERWKGIKQRKRLKQERRARHAAERQLAQWQIVSNTIPYGMWVTDSEGRIEYLSQSFRDLMSVQPEINSSSPWFVELLPTTLRGDWREVLHTGKSWQANITVIGHGGHTVHILSKGMPLRNQFGEIEQLVGINLDITREKEAEKRKDDFLRIASHELKSPITTIMSNLYLLEVVLREQDNVRLLPQVDRMRTQLKHLTNLVEDLLDVSKIEMGSLMSHFTIVSLNSLITQVSGQIKSEVESSIKVSIEKDIFLEADEYRLHQVVFHLLDNAIKFSPENDVVEIRARSDDAKVTIEVIDKGIGIAPEDEDKVFEKFYSGSNKQARYARGLGLGLFISKQIINLHQGTIRLNTKLNVGTTVEIELPLKQNQAV
jgi:signal transduction histidine kinase